MYLPRNHVKCVNMFHHLLKISSVSFILLKLSLVGKYTNNDGVILLILIGNTHLTLQQII